MNKTIVSDIETGKKLYPLVLRELSLYFNNIRQYIASKGISNLGYYFSEESKEKEAEFHNKLQKITGKDITLIESYLDEYNNNWEDLDSAIYCLKIAMPEPKIVEDISKEELFEICEIVKQENHKNNFNCFSGDIEHRFSEYFNDYFEKLLEINLQYLLEDSTNVKI